MPKAHRNRKPKSPPKRSRKRSKKVDAARPQDQLLLLPAQAASAVGPAKSWRRHVPSKRQRESAGRRFLRRTLVIAGGALALILIIGLTIDTRALQSHNFSLSETAVHDPGATKQLRALSAQISSFETAEQTVEIQVVPDATLEQQLSQIEVEIEVGKHHEATISMDKLTQQVTDDRAKLSHLSLAASGTVQSDGSLNVPILVYHQTPADFATQLDYLEQHGYHTITFAQLAMALHGQEGLPPKPVIITFDDGFADQMAAFGMLQQRHMTATYYIIDGGADSRWCIGAGRRYNDPLQPASGCGDAYLSWNQVRQLDRSGIITIGSHTIDHDNLASDTPTQQQYEITQGKHELEAQLGHKVQDFAYPYGSFNATTLQVVQQAGFTTAVTTTPGTSQSLATIYTLHRIRDPRMLP